MYALRLLDPTPIQAPLRAEIVHIAPTTDGAAATYALVLRRGQSRIELSAEEVQMIGQVAGELDYSSHRCAQLLSGIVAPEN